MSQELVSEINSGSYPSKTTNLRPDNLGSYYSDIQLNTTSHSLAYCILIAIFPRSNKLYSIYDRYLHVASNPSYPLLPAMSLSNNINSVLSPDSFGRKEEKTLSRPKHRHEANTIYTSTVYV